MSVSSQNFIPFTDGGPPVTHTHRSSDWTKASSIQFDRTQEESSIQFESKLKDKSSIQIQI